MDAPPSARIAAAASAAAAAASAKLVTLLAGVAPPTPASHLRGASSCAEARPAVPHFEAARCSSSRAHWLSLYHARESMTSVVLIMTRPRASGCSERLSAVCSCLTLLSSPCGPVALVFCGGSLVKKLCCGISGALAAQGRQWQTAARGWREMPSRRRRTTPPTARCTAPGPPTTRCSTMRSMRGSQAALRMRPATWAASSLWAAPGRTTPLQPPPQTRFPEASILAPAKNPPP